MAAEASEEIATRLLAALESSLVSLRDFPFAGAAREEFGVGLRVVFHGSYALYYMPQPDEVVIIRVLHGARDATALALRGGFNP